MSTRPRRHHGSGVRLGLNRCPRCHVDFSLPQQDWVACWGCLARHHAACWEQAGQCASCGEARSLGTSETLTAPSLPLLRLVLSAVVAASLLVAAAAHTMQPDLAQSPRVVPSVVEAAPTMAPPPAEAVASSQDHPPRSLPEGDRPARVDERFLALDEGDRAFDRGDYHGAIRAYGRALALEPGEVPAWVGRGNARARRGDIEGGLADLERALRLTQLDDPRRPLIESDHRAIRRSLFPEELGEAVAASRPATHAIRPGVRRYLNSDLRQRLRRLLDF
jgi:tetratricopeptide (TPR) repeat protein